MSRFANISLVNFPTLPPDEPERLQKTLDRMCSYIADAAQEQSDIVAFPEICNCLETADPRDAAESLDGPTIAALSDAARQHELYVVAPLLLVDAGRRYNCAALIDRKGEIVGVYRKNFPTHSELDGGITPGVETPSSRPTSAVWGSASALISTTGRSAPASAATAPNW